MVDLLPRSMIPVILRRANIDPAMQANALTKKDRRRLLSVLKGFDLTVTGRRPVAEAIITSGGVKVSEVDPKTISIGWGNGVLYDEDKVWADYKSMVASGLLRPEIAVGWYFDLPTETPKQLDYIRQRYMPEIEALAGGE